MRASYWARRAWNGVRKVAAGLTPFGESVWPGVGNDLFVAHSSIYGFFEGFAHSKRVFDAGCGTGYGADRLLTAGAASVLGVDVDPRSVRFARRHFARPGLAFEVGDCERLDLPPASFDLAVASNMVEHLERPEAFLAALRGALVPGGRLLLAVPPITTREAMAENDGIHYHRSNHTVDGWISLLEAAGWRWNLFAHRLRAGAPLPDFASPFPSRVAEADFFFEPASRDAVYERVPFTAVFLLEEERNA